MRIGDWVVDPSDGTLASNGQVIRLEPRVMAVLLFLVERRAAVVSHDELLAGVWRDAHVTPTSLARSISVLRRALGDDAKRPIYIETVPKRGYRLMPPAAAERRPSPGLRLAFVAVATLIALFTSLDAPRTRPGVPSSPSVNNRTRTGNENAFAHYTRAVSLLPSSAEAHAGLATALAFRADYLPNRRKWTSEAVDVATRAAALDPASSAAVKALGVAHLKASHFERAGLAYRRAMRMRPDDAGARNNLGVALLAIGRTSEALPLFEQQIAAEPDSPLGYFNLARGLAMVGYQEEAAAAAERVLLLDPYDRGAQLQLTTRDLLDGRYAAARERLERLLEVDRDCGRCVTFLGLIEERIGRLDEAERRYRRALEYAGDNEVPLLRLAHLALVRGQRAESERLAAREAERARVDLEAEVGGEGPPWRLAAAAAILGERDEAVRWYARAIDAGRRGVRWDRFDPLFAPLHGDVRFVALSDPGRFASDRRDAAAVVMRLASTLRFVDRRYAPFLAAPTFLDDPPGWPVPTKMPRQ